MAETELREKIVIDGVESSVSKLGSLAAAAGRVAHSFHGLTEIASAVGGIAGVWKIAETVQETDRLYQAIIRVQDITGAAAEQAHVMFDQFELSGVEMESAERIITSMTAKADKLASGMAGVGAQAQLVNRLMASVGVSIKDGPEERLLAMSKAAQDSKLNVNDLIQAFAIPRSQASAMLSMLKQGPERLKEIAQDTLHGADVIDDRTLQSYRTMIQARRELADAWGGLVGTLYKSLIPATTAILRSIKNEFDRIQPVADAIGRVLSKHMDAVVAATKAYVALLLTAKAINLFSENKLGVVARGRQVVSAASGFLGRRAATAGGLDYFAARAANPAIGLFQNVGGPLTRILGSVAGRFGVIGAIISVVVVAFNLLRNNVWGLGTAFKNVLGGTISHLGSAFAKLVGILKLLWSAIEPIIKIIAGALLLVLLGLAKGVELLAIVVEGVVDALIWVINRIIDLINLIPGVDIEELGAVKTAVAEQVAGDNKGGASVYQDFRGSKFDITQNFPQNIEGRVAVAFGDELAALGERRLESGLRPLYSIR